MNRLIIILIFIFFNSKADELSVQCNFEEVYKNGEIHQGIMLIKKNKLRYEYFEKNLFTLIYDNNDLYLIMNNETNSYEKIQKNKALFEQLMSIYNDYPNLKKKYSTNDYELILENTNNNLFIKRIAILSNKINLSIYFNNCSKKPINDLFFKFNPLFQLSSR